MVREIVNFTKDELNALLNDSNSCIEVCHSIFNLALYPYHLNDFKTSIRQILNKKVGKFDKSLNGILLAYKNVKVIANSGSILNDACFIHINVEADFYVFKPSVGSMLVGVVNKMGKDHIGCLVHKVFNVSIPQPDNSENWLGYEVNVEDKLILQTTYLSFTGRLPYIKGIIISTSNCENKKSKNSHKKFNTDEEIEQEQDEESPKKSKKHKRDKNESSEVSLEESKSKSKKKHKVKLNNNELEVSVNDNSPYEEINNVCMADSEDRYSKKNKKKSSKHRVSQDNLEFDLHDSDLEKILNDSKEKKKKEKEEPLCDNEITEHKKKKRKHNTTEEFDTNDRTSKHNHLESNNDISVEAEHNKKKRKHSSLEESDNNESSPQKKKRKHSLVENDDNVIEKKDESVKIKSKRKSKDV